MHRSTRSILKSKVNGSSTKDKECSHGKNDDCKCSTAIDRESVGNLLKISKMLKTKMGQRRMKENRKTINKNSKEEF